jgi:SsrA-binding protein
MSILLIHENKKARFDYEVIETFEAGLQLTGSEVKSLRDKNVQLKDSYVSFRGHEAYLQNAHISVYKASSYNNHEPERLRKLL